MSQLETYLKLAPSSDYFREDGDGLLWACLQAVATNKPFQIEEYMHEDGQTFRNPDMAVGRLLGPKESTISRDMYMGLFCYCLHFNRADILKKTASYGWKHWWKMGIENRKLDNRTWFTPGLVILLYGILAHLRGRPRLAKFLTGIYQPLSSTPGYQSHLAMLHIYLNRRIRGNLVTTERLTLELILQHSPHNALALALAGRKQETYRELATQWPRDRLPTFEDWTEGWRTQRQDNDSGLLSRQPGNTKPHSGGDFLFVHHVLAA
jgi:hypothetical protein